ncbi:MAG TPA: hypothetical protein DCL80_13910 [Balneola sp.]|nr:hypothetical protein [Balneola sp.]
MKLAVIPISGHEANDFIKNFHRHNKPVRGQRFSIGASTDKLVGVAIVGRPIARLLQDGLTAEITRVCVVDTAPKGTCSFLYGRCWRIWQQMGGKRMVTYTLQEESGASLRGAGWKIMGENKGGGWDREKRKRDWQPIYGQLKFRWEPPYE